MKTALNRILVASLCWWLVANARATVTNASWTFPAVTAPGPSQPLAANLAAYSTNDNLGWTEANNGLNEAFVSNPGKTTAFEFSYNGNHPAYLNGSTLTLTSTISGLTNGLSLQNIQLSYETKWNKTASAVTNLWAYSLNGGAFVNIQTNKATGNVWQSAGSLLAGLTLVNGDTLALRDTFSGASGNGGNLDFDNLEITSTVVTPTVVPEPSSLALATLCICLAAPWKLRRHSA